MKTKVQRTIPPTLLISVFVVAMLVALINMQARIGSLPGTQTEAGHSYRYHFAMVVNSDETPFWQFVYTGAQQRAAQQDAYVELMGSNLNEYYAVSDQFQMAAYAGVDGIFIVPDGEDYTNELIGRAVQSSTAPTPVLTLMENDSNSGRSGYVGINNYEQGGAYGRLIAEIAETKSIRSVMLLANATRGEDQKGGYSGDVIYSSLIESLNKSGLGDTITVDVRAVDHQNVFACEKDIKLLFQSGEVPDVLICPDYRFTISAAQVLVDQNLVAQVSLLGASLSREILEYVSKGTISAVVTVDPYQLGSVSVDEMIELMQNGRTNDFTALETILINQDNVDEYALAFAEKQP
ncbi:MAG: substrate-binding domain-containing protein [Eubacteriales bacterium]|nr:substrate-binding domain-containing protein [Eubacteriales bacterium]